MPFFNSIGRNTIHEFPIKEFLNSPKAKQKLLDVKLYFADQPHPEIETNFGEFKTNKKTNAFNKTDKFACNWAFLSAILQLQKRARSLGGDAVINIKSNYQNREYISRDKYQCGAGKAIAGCALIGTVVKLKSVKVDKQKEVIKEKDEPDNTKEPSSVDEPNVPAEPDSAIEVDK